MPMLDEGDDVPGLALLEFQDAVLAAAIEQTGAVRDARRAERAALAALEAAVISEGGTTSRADVLNASELVAVRQRQTRVTLTASMVSTLLADTLHARAVALGRVQQQEATLSGQHVNIVTGSSHALDAWRQP
jgi:hypothetical protein